MTVVLLIFLHGFKGGDHTFAEFPQRIISILNSNQSSKSTFKSIIYPAYKTRGLLKDAVDDFLAWLIEKYLEEKHLIQSNGDDKKDDDVKVILLAHSMGGLVIADSLVTLKTAAVVFPPILGLIAFDTVSSILHQSTLSFVY